MFSIGSRFSNGERKGPLARCNALWRVKEIAVQEHEGWLSFMSLNSYFSHTLQNRLQRCSSDTCRNRKAVSRDMWLELLYYGTLFSRDGVADVVIVVRDEGGRGCPEAPDLLKLLRGSINWTCRSGRIQIWTTMTLGRGNFCFQWMGSTGKLNRILTRTNTFQRDYTFQALELFETIWMYESFMHFLVQPSGREDKANKLGWIDSVDEASGCLWWNCFKLSYRKEISGQVPVETLNWHVLSADPGKGAVQWERGHPCGVQGWKRACIQISWQHFETSADSLKLSIYRSIAGFATRNLAQNHLVQYSDCFIKRIEIGNEVVLLGDPMIELQIMNFKEY